MDLTNNNNSQDAYNEITRDLAERFGINVDLANQDDRENSLGDIIEDIIENLLPEVAKRVRLQNSDLKKKLSLRFEISHVVNAYIQTTDEWKTFEITVNHALMMFYHKMLKVYVSTLSVGDKETGIIENQK